VSKLYFRNSIVFALAFFLSGAAAAPDAAKPVLPKREPIAVTSDRMEADKLGDKVTFLGDVTLKKESMTLYSDSLIVFYDPRSKGVREMEALGNVVVRREGRVALGNRAIYDSREEKIVLTGDARIIENDNEIGGEKIALFMQDDRSIVDAGKVLFYQDKASDKSVAGKKRSKDER